jgi:hypothetical protein
MLDAEKIQQLASVAGSLCSAHDELLTAGYSVWGTELKQLIEIVAAELAWLEKSAHSDFCAVRAT